MIQKDQPTIFGESVVVAVSSRDDGNLKFGVTPDVDVTKNRREFLTSNAITVNQTTSLKITYDRSDYAKYRIAGPGEKGNGMRQTGDLPVEDGLVVAEPNHALFLMLADCCGVVLYDPVKRVLMLSHIGRHSVEVDGGARSVTFLQENYGSKPADLQVWLSPAVGKAAYPITKKDGRGLRELILEQLQSAGVQPGKVEICEVDTATDPSYFSHSQFKAGNQAIDGRFAVIAMMNEQGEPAV